ncbi:ABC transporter substrate-binding protein [Mycetocola reblochoni]|uniref:Thiamine pyrimidine synthase n=2 Tax=Mycetocola reblochoni TaxID=331618 RepID=A0A1R4J2Q0_9MICO|nr:ABC transporter substrate-binding protein [Mycetocola reblochoni]RLP71236.1 ABC transporter substrate-binding protein [Mycetocola reblochoni]SJN26025.1 Hydroxymethylpyrimidine ABC transporter, substrate-binding component [Mycetocola reblochoni REB411]
MRKTPTRGVVALTALAVTALALSGCSAAQDDDSAELTTVRFGLPTQMGANNSPMAVAEELGYFAEEGIDLEIVFTTDSTSIIQGVDSGSLEVGSTPPEPLLQTIENGGDVALVYNYIRQQTGSIASLADGPVQEIGDLEGGVVGQASLGTSNLLLSNGILSEAGLVEDVDFTNLAVGTGAAALQALESNQVQALSLWDTEYAAFESQGVELTYFTTDEVASLFSTTYFTSPAYVEDNPDVVAGFGRAMAKATLFTATNPEAALRIMYEAYPDTLVAGTSMEEQLATTLVALERRVELLTADDPQGTSSWGAYSDAAVSAWEDFSVDAGIVASPVDLAAHIDGSLVERYNDFDGDAVVDEAESWSAE